MRKLSWVMVILSVLIIGLTFLPSCNSSEPPTVLYEGVLEKVATVKNETTITFANNVAVTSWYTPNVGDKVLIYGEIYDLTRDVICNDTRVYLVRSKP
jgi:hypothetical protein